jgi:hypothetical protein
MGKLFYIINPKDQMRTPAGVECPFFYGDYYRGRKQEECRLIGSVPSPKNWSPDLCRSCPVPGILRANACSNMVLEGRVERNLLGLRRRVKVSAFCTLSKKVVTEPYIGCGECHPLSFSLKEPHDPNPSS